MIHGEFPHFHAGAQGFFITPLLTFVKLVEYILSNIYRKEVLCIAYIVVDGRPLNLGNELSHKNMIQISSICLENLGLTEKNIFESL